MGRAEVPIIAQRQASCRRRASIPMLDRPVSIDLHSREGTGDDMMKLPRRHFLRLAAGALPTMPLMARAQAYPTRPVRIVVGFPAGGPTDIMARLMGQWLSEELGRQFVIENRPGASGNVGTESVAKASPDGYTLLQVSSANAINTTLYDKLNFNFIRDLAPVASISSIPLVIEVNPSVPARTLPEFIAYA